VSNPEAHLCFLRIPSPLHPDPQTTPSDTTLHELRALTIFRDTRSRFAPHFVAFTSSIQSAESIFTTTDVDTSNILQTLPGGYITYTVMTALPGSTLFSLNYWGLEMKDDERDVIKREFLIALRGVYAAGVEPVDRGLRNIMWDGVGKKW
jgi:hypothetical protein